MAIGRVNTGGGGSGGTLEVTAPVGVTVTATKSGKSYTRTANAQGKATFKGLASGVWSVTISDGTQTSAAVGVTVTADYAVTMAFFSATINVTYPAGSTCTCTKGGTTLTASGTGGSYTFTVPEAGEWTVSCTNGDKTASKSVTITAQGQIESVSLSYELYLLHDGVLQTGYTLNKSGAGTLSQRDGFYELAIGKVNSWNAVLFQQAVDLSSYSVVHFDLTLVGGSRSICVFNTDNPTKDSDMACYTQLQTNISQRQEITLAIEAVSTGYIGAKAKTADVDSGNYSANVKLYNVWLT